MGRNKDSFKLICRDSGSLVQLEAVKFFDIDSLRSLLSEEYGEDMVDRIITNPREVNLKLDILFRPCVNDWNGRKCIQLSMIDYRISR
jgi:single-stranded-DNA-specific exonuclease